MQSSHFESFTPTTPYLTSFEEIKRENQDFKAMDYYFKRHPFTYSFLNQSDKELNDLRKLRKECNRPFQFRPRARMNFHELDQINYLRQMNPEHKQIMQKQAQHKYQLVKDYHKFPYEFHQKQDQLYSEELKMKTEQLKPYSK
uniref:Uncharacterized protein n=1 Tax=viral metagenome TaxID=1070528 RepID=A0A6C0EBF5_9ZZZZ